jgi:hypothetical protein
MTGKEPGPLPPGFAFLSAAKGAQVESTKRFIPEPTSVPGDFYVEYNCCTSCGVPQAVAPDLIGWVETPINHCYWKKQPETPGELERALKIFDGQELGCHRYSGHDPEIQHRVGYDQCDYPLPMRTRTLVRLSSVHSEHWGERVVQASKARPRVSLWSRLFRRKRS